MRCIKAFALYDYYLAGEELKRHSRYIYDLQTSDDGKRSRLRAGRASPPA
jgi:hypothetical protein